VLAVSRVNLRDLALGTTTVNASAARTTDHRSPTIQRIAANGSGERAYDVILMAPPRLNVPTSSLFVIHSEPGSRTLIETDPRFTQYKNFISSDYALQQLNKDPERQLKRYGDGFVEQQLVNDQVLALTGRRFLSGYSSTEDEYKKLMDNGVAFARQYQLTPGVALSAEQMANLTTDIVWLTTQTVTLPNGQTTQVLVPQVYLRRPQSGDLQASGALISGSTIAIQSERDLLNSGSVNASGSVTLLAGNDLINQSGTLRGQDIVVRANNDLKNLSGTIQGTGTDSHVTLLAGRDIVLQTRTIDSSAGTGIGSVTSARTSVDRIATLQGGSVRLDAGRDITAIGTVAKADNDLIATAGRDLTVSAVQGQYQLTIATGGNTMGRTGAIKENSTTNIASSLSGKNVVLVAQNDATISGSNLTAANNLQIQATNIQVTAAKDRNVTDVQNVGVDRYTRAMRDDEKLIGGNLNAGNNLTLQATGTATQAAATQSGGNITLTGANLNAQAG
jgi:filamentous hemagglutinin